MKYARFLPLWLISLSTIPFAIIAQQAPQANQGARGASTPTTTQASGIVISGRVAKAGGEPLKKATVTLRPAAQGGGGRGGQGGRGGGQNGQTGTGAPGQPLQLDQLAQPGQAGLAGQQPGNRGGGPGAQRSVTTGDDGSYSFTDVPAGQYRLTADRDGFLTQEYGQKSVTGQGTSVTVAAGQKLTSIDFQMIQGGTIAGRIVDEDGEPMVGIQVQALSYEYRQGQRTLVPDKQGQTNDLGEYRLYWLDPGEYYVSAVPNPFGQGGRGGRGGGGGRGGPGGPVNVQTDPSAPAESLAPSYYPSGIDPLRAAPVEMSPGADLRGIDFAIRPVLTGKVTGSVLAPAAPPPPSTQQQAQNQQNQNQQGGRGGRGGQQQAQPQQAQPQQPAQQAAQQGGGRGGQNQNGQGNGGGRGGNGGTQVFLLSRAGGGGGGGGGRGGRGGGGFGAAQPGGTGTVRADGSFEISNVVPGSYTIAAISRQNNAEYTATAPVNVGEGGLQSVTLALRPGVDIKGQLYLDGPQVSGLVAGTAQGGQQGTQQFRMANVRVVLNPADDLPIGNQGNGGSAAKDDGTFTMNNIPALRYRLSAQVPAGAYLIAGNYGGVDALNGPIEVNDGGTLLQLQLGLTPGRVEGNVLDRTGQPYSGATVTLVPAVRTRLDLYKTATSDVNGHFTFANSAPGDYKVFAWEEIQQGAWQDPAYLDRFEDRGRLIHLEKSGSATEQITLIPSGRN